MSSPESDDHRLQAAFDDGDLIHPSADALNLVDLARAAAWLAGSGDVTMTAGSRRIAKLIGPSQHLVLVLADGFGMDLLEAMDRDSFAPSHLATELQTVFPSTTSAALTSLATAEWPVTHAVLGWFLYLPEVDAVTTILPFVRRSDEASLTTLGVTPAQAFPIRPAISGMRSRPLSLIPEALAGSVYSDYLGDGTPIQGYRGLERAVDEVVRKVTEADESTFTYLYWPTIDAVCHERGTRHPQTSAAVRRLDDELRRLSATMPPGTRVVVTADHGLLDTHESQMHWIEPRDALASCLSREPSGDTRVVYFSLRKGKETRFRDEFARRFEGRFILLSRDEALELELFGPGTPSSQTGQRLGDLVAISLGADIIRFDYLGVGRGGFTVPDVAHHSGLTPTEMRIPLIVI